MSSPGSTKEALRRRMRAVRRAVPDPATASEKIWLRLRDDIDSLPDDRESVVMLYRSIRGEPITDRWVDQLRAGGTSVVFPEDVRAPDQPDLIVVPGLAFTPAGHRLGQGGGWYDRFLSRVPATTPVIGVCFDAQVIETVPIEAHDRPVAWVITERRRVPETVIG